MLILALWSTRCWALSCAPATEAQAMKKSDALITAEIVEILKGPLAELEVKFLHKGPKNLKRVRLDYVGKWRNPAFESFAVGQVWKLALAKTESGWTLFPCAYSQRVR